MPQLRAILIGFFIACWVLPPTPVKAQFAVHDLKMYLLKIKEIEQNAKKWLDQYNQMVTLIQQGSQLLSSTRGILTLAETAASKDDETRRILADLGTVIVNGFNLKRQFERSVFQTITGIKAIETRLKGGIFDPEQNLRDLEEYFTENIGRICQVREANLVKLADADPQLKFLIQQLQNLYIQISQAERDYNTASLKLAAETVKGVLTKNPPSSDAIKLLRDQMAKSQQTVNELEAEKNRLLTDIEKRCKDLHIVFDERATLARHGFAFEQAWLRFSQTKDQLLSAIDDYGTTREGK